MRTLTRGEFHGARRDTRRIDGLTLAETEYEPGHRLPLHAHEHPFFSLLLRGSYTEQIHRGSRRLLPASLVFYPENEPHADAFDDGGGRAFNVEMASPWLNRIREFGINQPAGSDEIRRSRLNGLAIRLYVEFLKGDQPSDLTSEEVVLEMLAELSGLDLGGEFRRPQWMDRVREHIHAHYLDAIRVSDLAHEAGVHPVHLARVFRRFHGCTVGTYVRRLRVEHACAALAQTGTSLAAIAYDTGFADQAHFTRRFKESTGISPGAYRKLVAS